MYYKQNFFSNIFHTSFSGEICYLTPIFFFINCRQVKQFVKYYMLKYKKQLFGDYLRHLFYIA